MILNLNIYDNHKSDQSKELGCGSSWKAPGGVAFRIFCLIIVIIIRRRSSLNSRSVGWLSQTNLMKTSHNSET